MREEKLKKQEQLIREIDWDVLVVLDACRYDYFKKIYYRYMNGELEKVISPASHTDEWRKKSFPLKYDDVVYVSANPFINSRAEVNGYDSKKHFHKIVDVWNQGWNEKYGTVLPSQVTEASIEARVDYPSKRIVVHYMQPHGPYLSLKLSKGLRPEEVTSEGKGDATLTHALDRIKAWLRWRMVDLFGMGKVSKIWDQLGFQPFSTHDAALRMVGRDGIRRAYLENLKIVFRDLTKLIKKLPNNRIIITSDHGEFLGEGDDYGHRSGLRHSVLIEVPWFEVKECVANF